jgi:hypothetical protein
MNTNTFFISIIVINLIIFIIVYNRKKCPLDPLDYNNAAGFLEAKEYKQEINLMLDDDYDLSYLETYNTIINIDVIANVNLNLDFPDNFIRGESLIDGDSFSCVINVLDTSGSYHVTIGLQDSDAVYGSGEGTLSGDTVFTTDYKYQGDSDIFPLQVDNTYTLILNFVVLKDGILLSYYKYVTNS